MRIREEKNSRVRSRVLIIVVALAVSLVGLAFDRMLLHEGIPRYDLLGISNLLTGIVAGGFYWQLIRRERERRDFIRERLFVISEMNHHIRNALQVISFYSYRKQDSETLVMLQQAVTRIEWALKEVLPGEHVEDFARAGLANELQPQRRN
jgi:two-component sensor histidine kinase